MDQVMPPVMFVFLSPQRLHRRDMGERLGEGVPKAVRNRFANPSNPATGAQPHAGGGIAPPPSDRVNRRLLCQ
jgi:hypothetical protein